MIEKVVFMNMCMISDNKGNVLALDKVGKNYLVRLSQVVM